MENLIYYYDISKKGIDLTGNKDVGILFNEQAVLESVVNIITTEPGQRIMQPNFGTRLKKYLFEPLDILTAEEISDEIKYAIERFEPRIDQLEVKTFIDEQRQTFVINVFFSMKISNNFQKLSFSLSKIR